MTRAPRRRAVAALVALAVLLATACGENDAGSARLHVAARVFAWEDRGEMPAATATFGSRWRPSEPDAGWRIVRGERLDDAHALRARGRGRVVLASAPGAPIDATLAHRLVLRGDAAGVEELVVSWIDLEGREHAFPTLAMTRDVADHTWIAELEPPHDAGSPAMTRGCTGLSVLARATSGATSGVVPLVELALEEVLLVSDFDLPDEQTFATGRHEWGGVSMDGLRTRVPARLALPITPRGGDRLLLSAAVPQAGTSVELVVRDAAGALPPARWTVRGGEPWQHHEVVLEGLGHDPVTLLVELHGDASRALLGGVLHLARDARERPPVLLYLEDTLRADRLGVYGHPQPTSPALDAIAAQGVVLERCFAASNWTRTAVSTMLSGLEPAAHGNLELTDRVAREAPLLPEVLAAQGYLTVLVSTNRHVGRSSGLERGFDVVHELSAFPPLEGDTSLTSPLVHDVVEGLLARLPPTAFFVWAHSVDPHDPYAPPGELLLALASSGIPRARLQSDDPQAVAQHASKTLAYEAEILHNDRQLARLDALLARHGLAEDLLFVFASDHGEAFGEHGTWGHYQTLLQPELHVPWILRWPRRLPAGVRLDRPASQLDLAPTLLGLLGLSAPPAWTGRDLSAWLRAPEAAAPHPAVLLADAAMEGERQLAAIAWPYKLVARRGADGALEPLGLFDLAADPGERVDLLAQAAHAPARAGLLAELDALSARIAAQDAVAPGDDGATRVNAAEHEWMRAMGYLR